MSFLCKRVCRKNNNLNLLVPTFTVFFCTYRCRILGEPRCSRGLCYIEIINFSPVVRKNRRFCRCVFEKLIHPPSVNGPYVFATDFDGFTCFVRPSQMASGGVTRGPQLLWERSTATGWNIFFLTYLGMQPGLSRQHRYPRKWSESMYLLDKKIY